MISLIVPTRNRPKNIQRLYQSWCNSNSQGELIVLTDDDDKNRYYLPRARVIKNPRTNTVAKINMGAELAKGDILGFCGDDCIIQTKDWEQILIDNMTAELSMAYVGDGHDQHNVPNHVFMNRVLYETLGWFGYPLIHHCFSDHVWRKIGQHLAGKQNGLYVKVPVVFFHDHPDYTDAEYDEVYQEAYNPRRAATDKQHSKSYKPRF